MVITDNFSDSGGAKGELGRDLSKLSKRNDIKLDEYTFRLKNYVKVPSTSFGLFRSGAVTVSKNFTKETKNFKNIVYSIGVSHSLLQKDSDEAKAKCRF